MTTDAVATGTTPYRSPPLPVPRWGTPACSEEVAGWIGRAPSREPADPVTLSEPAPVHEHADRGFLAERQPGGWASVTDTWSDSDSAADVVSRYLAPGERDRYLHLAPAVRPTWLLGRVAAKDAVRWWLAEHGRAAEPAEVVLDNEPSGRPVIDTGRSTGGSLCDLDLRVSIAHLTGTAVAIVSHGSDVGIDVEEAAPRPRSFARVAFSPSERAERAEHAGRFSMDENTWMAATWCAKEAAGKADGTGLRGRPTRFVTHLIGPDLFRVGHRLVRCTQLDPVRYCSFAGHPLVVGWTLSSTGSREYRDDGPHP